MEEFVNILERHVEQPSFLIIGAQKGGTTSLYYHLTEKLFNLIGKVNW